MMIILTTKQVLQKTTQLCLERLALFTTGILLFGVLSAATTLWVESHFSAGALTVDKVQSSDLGKILNKLQTGETVDILSIAHEIQANSTAGLDALSLLSSFMPTMYAILWSAFASMIIAFISSIYFVAMSVPLQPSVLTTVLQFWLSIPAMILILIWSSVRSLSWIPVIGPLIGLFLYPRFMFAPIIYMGGEKNLLLAVKESYTKTAGHSWYILSVFSIVSFIAMVVAFIAVGLLAFSFDSFLGQYSVFMRGIVWQAALGYTVLSVVIMWREQEPEPRVTETLVPGQSL